MVGKVIIAHEEDPELDRGGQMNESALSAELGLKGMPRIAEETFIQRDIAIAEYVGSPIHITHISTKGSVEIIRAAKKRGIRVTCDVTPHHLVLTEELVATFDPRYKMNPPLRTKEDMDALREGLCDGTIDAIATDHAPHSKEIKDIEFIFSAFGVTGLETAVPVLQKELIDRGIITWNDLAKKMSANPAGILGIPGGTLAPGAIADITIYDPNSRWKLDPVRMRSRSVNTPFFGWELPGKTFATIVGGKINFNK